MQSRQAPRNTDALSALGVAALLALGLGMNPATASPGAGARCDRSVDAPSILDARAEQLRIDVVDHGAARAVGADDLPDDAASITEVPVASPVDMRPRVEIILRRIFDEPQLRAPEITQPDDADTLRAPLAVDQIESIEEPATTLDGDGSTGSATGLPGVSDDDLLRFRQQMHRSDI